MKAQSPPATECRIQTYSGLLVDPLNMTPGELNLQDIAHALGNICRFGGACARFYSVAEHSINVANITGYVLSSVIQPAVLTALLHDASEAYLNDVIRPLKQHPKFSFYLEVEAEVQTMIYQKYLGTDENAEWLQAVKDADDIMLGIEARDLMALPPAILNGKDKASLGAQRAWGEVWCRYTKLIPDELYYRVSVAQAPPHKRSGERRAVLGDRITGEYNLTSSQEWLEMVRNLLMMRSPGVVFE